MTYFCSDANSTSSLDEGEVGSVLLTRGSVRELEVFTEETFIIIFVGIKSLLLVFKPFQNYMGEIKKN